jgi:hypothetical protein
LEKIDDSDKTAIGHRFCADIYNNRTDLLKCLCDQDLRVSFAGRLGCGVDRRRRAPVIHPARMEIIGVAWDVAPQR